jgi:hypothetical protein
MLVTKWGNWDPYALLIGIQNASAAALPGEGAWSCYEEGEPARGNGLNVVRVSSSSVTGRELEKV